MFGVLANSAAALEGYVSLGRALSGGSIDVSVRASIGLAVAEFNATEYSLSGHTYSARHAGIDDAAITANRNGASNDPKVEAAVAFAAAIVRGRGNVSEGEISAVRSAGYCDCEILEIVAIVAHSVFENYLNGVARTDVDFPVIRPFGHRTQQGHRSASIPVVQTRDCAARNNQNTITSQQRYAL